MLSDNKLCRAARNSCHSLRQYHVGRTHIQSRRGCCNSALFVHFSFWCLSIQSISIPTSREQTKEFCNEAENNKTSHFTLWHRRIALLNCKLPTKWADFAVVDISDRKSVVKGKRVSVRVDLGVYRIIKT